MPDAPGRAVTVVEVRCPVGPRKLFTRLKIGLESARHIEVGNLIEFTCWDCARRRGRLRGRSVRVYHQFNFIGELVRTLVEEREQSDRGTRAPTD
jgi:hypothetical protein